MGNTHLKLELPQSSGTPPQANASGSRTRLFLIIGGVVLAVVLCCAVLAFGGVFGGFQIFQTVTRELDGAQATVRSFLDAGERNDVDAAMDLFASGAMVSRSEVEDLFVRGRTYFEGYGEISQNQFNINTNNGVTTAEIGGSISYASGPDATFDARLRKQGDVWYLESINFDGR
jgi:ABC-type antimicrobial peptide transport system permease subunit